MNVISINLQTKKKIYLATEKLRELSFSFGATEIFTKRFTGEELNRNFWFSLWPFMVFKCVLHTDVCVFLFVYS